MNEHIKLLIEDIKKLWLKLDINQKFSIAALLVAMFVVGIFFIVKATEPNWTVLYSDLSKQDVAAITESLKKSGYAYKLSEDKTAILVKNQDKEDLRLFVAENDLIKDTTGGFELLDDLQLGSTDFKNKLTKQRIFQGELTRSIERINGVSKARVQLAEPERSIFSDEDEEPSASVVLILEPGVRLKASQIMAIKNLVAYSVPRLTNDRVFLTDQNGNVLSEDVAKNSSDMQTYRTNFEKEAAKKIKDTLETIMGKDNVSVQVSTVMDFNQTRATIESYTPNKDSHSGIIVAQQGEKEVYSNPQQLPSNNKEKETTQENNTIENTGVNPAQNELQQAQQAQVQDPATLPLNQTPVKTVNYNDNENTKADNDVRKLSYEKEKSATTYAVTKEVKQVVYAPGAVTRMSVAVAVNKILTDEEKKEIENLVIAATGMDKARGDIVNVTSLKFTGIDNSEELEQDKAAQQAMTMEILTFIFKNVSPVFIILILGLIALHNFGNIFKAPKPNSILGNPEEAARILTSYIKE